MMMAGVDKTFRPVGEVDLCSPPSEEPGQSPTHANKQTILISLSWLL